MNRVFKATTVAAALTVAVAFAPSIAAASGAPTVPEIPGCTAVIGEREHPYYGHGWLAQCEDGIAFVVPAARGHWAIVYSAFPDLPYVEPAWVGELLRQAALKGD
jgi:hypothetical protein